MNKASAHCVETPELAQHQKQSGDASVIPGRLPSCAERQGRIGSRGEPLALLCALTCAEGCTANTSSQMLLKIHYACPCFFLSFLFSQKMFPSEYVSLLQQELSFAYMFIQHKHKEHLVSDKDTVAKQIQNTDRKPKCRERLCAKGDTGPLRQG